MCIFGQGKRNSIMEKSGKFQGILFLKICGHPVECLKIFNYFFVSPAKHSDTGITLSVVCLSVRPSIRPSVRLSVCLSVRLSHSHNYISQGTHAFLGMLPLFLCIYLDEEREGCANACICIGTHIHPLLQNCFMDIYKTW